MARELADGTIIPSYLSCVDTTRGPMHSSGMFGNMALRVGEVVDVFYPSDNLNISKKFIEYQVQVQLRDGSDPGTATSYSNVMIANLFGGAADKLTYTLRKRSLVLDKETGRGNGSKVLLLCINGERNSASIIAGIRDPKLETDVETAAAGHNLNFEFNGLQATINKDGELVVTFNGPTGPTNKLLDSADPNAVGSFASFTKDGSITVQNATEDVIIDHPNQQVHIDAASNVTIKSAGVLTGSASDATVLGTTYRKAEDEMLQSIASQASSLNTSFSLMAAFLNTAGSQSSFSSAAPFLKGAGQEAQNAASAISNLQQAINNFINNGPYLSTKNFSD